MKKINKLQVMIEESIGAYKIDKADWEIVMIIEILIILEIENSKGFSYILEVDIQGYDVSETADEAYIDNII